MLIKNTFPIQNMLFNVIKKIANFIIVIDNEKLNYVYVAIHNEWCLFLAQIKEIRHSSLARLICDNTDNINQIQPEAMKLPFRDSYETYEWVLAITRVHVDLLIRSKQWILFYLVLPIAQQTHVACYM